MKKIFTKIVSLALVASFGFAFAACSKDSKDSDETTTPDAAVVEEADKAPLVMACSADFPPYEFVDGDVVTGIDAEIAKAIADKLGRELVIENVSFDSIIAGVQSGKFDIGMSGITITEDRKESVNFTVSYTTAVQSILLPVGSEITDIDMLIEGDYKVAVQTGTTGDIYMTDDLGEDRVDRYTKYSDAVLALTTGKVDAVCLDNQPALAFAEANADLFVFDTPYALEDYAIAISKDDEQLLADINTALVELEEDGTIAAIIEKYIPSEG